MSARQPNKLTPVQKKLAVTIANECIKSGINKFIVEFNQKSYQGTLTRLKNKGVIIGSDADHSYMRLAAIREHATIKEAFINKNNIYFDKKGNIDVLDLQYKMKINGLIAYFRKQNIVKMPSGAFAASHELSRVASAEILPSITLNEGEQGSVLLVNKFTRQNRLSVNYKCTKKVNFIVI